MLKLGENLRCLRLAKGCTQEELAQVLGVSSQAVSRWENSATYPDITLLPCLADYFDVTLDELMGMEEHRRAESLNGIFTAAHEMQNRGDAEGAIRLYRQAVRSYPNNCGLLSELALALSAREDEESLGEAIALSEKVLQNCTNEKVRGTTRANLCFLYRRRGDVAHASALALSSPHIWECREMLQPDMVPEEARDESLRRAVHTVLAVLRDRIAGVTPTFALGYAPVPDAADALSEIAAFLKEEPECVL